MPFQKGNKEQLKGKKGKHKRTQEWEQLGEFVTETGAKRVMKYLNNIEDDAEFFEKYERLLNYFKPRMQATQLNAEVKTPDIQVTVNANETVKALDKLTDGSN